MFDRGQACPWECIDMTRPDRGDHGEIRWRDWSEAAFEEAAREDRLVLLDLTATWCHWCHVMDGTTYSDPDVVRTVNEEFVPVRVDIDRRPDISERYNRGGFPTTAFLSHAGESVWGATYVPPGDMKRIMGALLEAKRSGEIGRALERAKAQGPRTAPARPRGGAPSDADLEDLLLAVIGARDREHGGFGTEPKFPHPDALDLMMTRHARSADPVLSSAVRLTLERMSEGLYDQFEGGVFRYSVTRDWSVPHYEKMLETNLGFMRNLARAKVTFNDGSFGGLAEGVAAYLMKNLRDPGSGAFYGSQDADEGYYRLRPGERARRAAPSIDRTVYSGWNALASSVFMEAGVLLDRGDWVDVGLAALDRLLESAWDPGRRLVRHTADLDLFLFEDQVELMSVLVESIGHRDMSGLEGLAVQLVEGVKRSFSHADGGFGDIVPGDGIGELAAPVRSLVSNAKWAHRMALMGMATDRHEWVEEASEVLRSFDMRTVSAHGVFASSYITARDSLASGPLKVEVHSSKGRCTGDPLWVASKKALDPGTVSTFVRDSQDFAVICSRSGCSAKIEDPSGLVRAMRTSHKTQV